MHDMQERNRRLGPEDGGNPRGEVGRARDRFRRLRNVLRAGRAQPFKRREQLGVVWLSNLVILAGVWGIMAAFGMASSPPAWFIGFEAAILVGCGLLTFRIDASMLLAAPKRLFPSEGEERPKRTERDLEGVAGLVLLFAYALQFAALVPLLRDTGGPVTSPFGQLIVAFAIFAPFIANNWITSVTVLVTGAGGRRHGGRFDGT